MLANLRVTISTGVKFGALKSYVFYVSYISVIYNFSHNTIVNIIGFYIHNALVNNNFIMY